MPLIKVGDAFPHSLEKPETLTVPLELAEPAANNQLLLTVGTTNFDSLIEHLDKHRTQFFSLLIKRGFSALVVQLGNTSRYLPSDIANWSVDPICVGKLTVHAFNLLPSLQTHLKSSSFVICHAGAGSILDCLRLNKPLITVVNSTLMDNHQQELAQHLAKLNYIYMANASNLLDVFEKCSIEEPMDETQSPLSTVEILPPDHCIPPTYKLIKYPPPNPRLFIQILDQEMGFV